MPCAARLLGGSSPSDRVVAVMVDGSHAQSAAFHVGCLPPVPAQDSKPCHTAAHSMVAPAYDSCEIAHRVQFPLRSLDIGLPIELRLSLPRLQSLGLDLQSLDMEQCIC